MTESVKVHAFLRFIECDTCAALPGTPPLCAGCLHNRAVISAYDMASLKGDPQAATMHGDAGRTKTWLRARDILNTPQTR